MQHVRLQAVTCVHQPTLQRHKLDADVASCLQYEHMTSNTGDSSLLACKHSWDCTRALRVAVWRAWVSSRRQIWACNTLARRAPTSFKASGLRARFFSSEANKRAVWKYAMRMACVAVVLQPTHRQPLHHTLVLLLAAYACQKREEKNTPLGVNVMSSHVLYLAIQGMLYRVCYAGYAYRVCMPSVAS